MKLKLRNLIYIIIFIHFSYDANGTDFSIEFNKGGNFSLRIESTANRELSRNDDIGFDGKNQELSDARLMFSNNTDLRSIYYDTIKINRGYETVQILTGKVNGCEGMKSVRLTVLNCRTGEIYGTFADDKGKFAINVNEFVDSTVFNIDACDNLNKRKKFFVVLDESVVPEIPFDVHADVEETTEYYWADTVRELKNITVKARRPKALNRFKIEPTKGYFDGDPAIYRYPNIMSLLRSIGVYKLEGFTILLDNQTIQRSSDTDDDYTFDEDIESYLNMLNINDVYQIEYIAHDPRKSMFQSFQKGTPVLLIFTKAGVYDEDGKRSRAVSNSFVPLGYQKNMKVAPWVSSDNSEIWIPELIVNQGETIDLKDFGVKDVSNLIIGIRGITDDGEFVDINCLVTAQ